MAKVKGRKRGTQVSRETVAKAQYAKRHGLISSRAKTSGTRLSGKVLDKLATLERAALLPQYETNAKTGKLNAANAPRNTTVKVSKSRADELRSRGYVVIGNQAVAPKGDKRYTQAVKGEGPFASGGIRFQRNELDRDVMPSGQIDVLNLRGAGINSFRDLFETLRRAQLNGVGKRYHDEVWAFTYFGNYPKFERTFATDAELLRYLEHYKSIVDEVEADDGDDDMRRSDNDDPWKNFELVRLRRGENLGFTPNEIRKRNRRTFRSDKDRRKDKLKLEASTAKKNHSAEYVMKRREARNADQRRYMDALREAAGEQRVRDERSEARARQRAAKKPK